MHEKPLGGRIVTPVFVVCLAVIAFLIYYSVKRLFLGLGATTGMNDGYPWGIWIAYDMVTGSALGCGGYVMALMTYVLNRGHYHPLVRPALLASIFGYSLGGVSILLDLGRYLNIWNLFVPPRMNFHSAMLEVALCVTTYCCVMILEFAPAIAERFKLKKFGEILDRVIFLLIALGVLLPTMHQSSLGTMMFMAGTKLSPLWHTILLPFFFLMTALFIGFSMVVFESTISHRVYRLGDETSLLARIGAILSVFIAVFLLVRLQSLHVGGHLGEAFSGSFYSNMFIIEFMLLLGGMLTLWSRRMRHSAKGLFIAATLILLGGAMYRFNVYLIGYDPGNGWRYFPPVSEQMITFGFIAVEIAAYAFCVKYFPVFSVGHESAAHHS